jgi:hypothetical protein
MPLGGAMTTIVIGLAAVVVLILVIVLLAMRYLRADDGDDFDEMPRERGRASGAAAGGARLAAPPRTGRAARPAPAGQRGRAARPGWDERDSYPGQRPPARRDEAQRQQDSLPDIRPRQARGKQPEDDGDWPSTDWDSLSDVDYWAEVASDKPLTTTAQPAAQSRPARAEPDRAGQAAPHGRPVQRRPEPSRAEAGAPGQDLAQRRRSPAQRPAAPAPAPRPAPRRPAPAAGTGPQRLANYLPAPVNGHAAAAAAGEPTLAMLASMGNSQRPPGLDDDDPLTSPSFPKVQDDSRSYRNGRPAASPPGSRLPDPAAASLSRVPPDPGPATQQFMAPAIAAARADGYRPGDYRPASGPPTDAGGYAPPGGPADHGLPYPPPSAGGYQRQHGHPANGHSNGNGRRHAAPLPAAPGGPSPYDGAPGNPYDSYPGHPAQAAPRRPAGGQPGTGPNSYPATGPHGYPAAGPSGYPASGPSGYPAAGRAERPYPPSAEPPRNGNAFPQHNGHGNGSGWYQDRPASGPLPPADSGYPSGGGTPGGYPGIADYQTAAYPAQPYEPSRPAAADPYAGDPYRGYPGQGSGGR